MGDRFSAKDFRTWAGTLICAAALPAVCRGSYIAPARIDCYNAGETMNAQPGTIDIRRRAPARSEQALLRLLRRRLRRGAPAAPWRIAA